MACKIVCFLHFCISECTWATCLNFCIQVNNTERNIHSKFYLMITSRKKKEANLLIKYNNIFCPPDFDNIACLYHYLEDYNKKK